MSVGRLTTVVFLLAAALSHMPSDVSGRVTERADVPPAQLSSAEHRSSPITATGRAHLPLVASGHPLRPPRLVPVAHAGGAYRDLVASQGRAFVAAGGHVAWLAQDRDWQPWAVSPLLPTIARGIGGDGTTLWAALGSHGVVRFGEPDGRSLPIVDAFVIPDETVRDVAPVGHTLFLAAGSGLLVVEDEAILAARDLPEGADSVTADGVHVLVESPDGVRLFEYQNRELQQLVHLTDERGLLASPWLFTASVDAVRTWEIDSAEGSVTERGAVETYGPHRLALNVRGALALSGHHLLAGGVRRIYVVDVADPAEPMVTGVVEDLGAIQRHLAVVGEHLLAVEGWAGPPNSSTDMIRIIQVDDGWPTVGSVNQPLGSTMCTPLLSFLLCREGSEWNLVDVSEPRIPRIVSSFDQLATGPAVAGDTAFWVLSAYGDHRLLAVTFSASGTILSRHTLTLPPGASSVTLDRPRRMAYVQTAEAWIEVDVGIPSDMWITGRQPEIDSLFVTFHDGIGYWLTEDGSLARLSVTDGARLPAIRLPGRSPASMLVEGTRLLALLDADAGVTLASVDIPNGRVTSRVVLPGCPYHNLDMRWAAGADRAYVRGCGRLAIVGLGANEITPLSTVSANLGPNLLGDPRLILLQDKLFMFYTRWEGRLWYADGAVVAVIQSLTGQSTR